MARNESSPARAVDAETGLAKQSIIGNLDNQTNAPKAARTQAEKNEKNLWNGRYLRHGELLIRDVPARLWCKITCKGIWERSSFRLAYPDVIELLAYARQLERAADERERRS